MVGSGTQKLKSSECLKHQEIPIFLPLSQVVTLASILIHLTVSLRVEKISAWPYSPSFCRYQMAAKSCKISKLSILQAVKVDHLWTFGSHFGQYFARFEHSSIEKLFPLMSSSSWTNYGRGSCHRQTDTQLDGPTSHENTSRSLRWLKMQSGQHGTFLPNVQNQWRPRHLTRTREALS